MPTPFIRSLEATSMPWKTASAVVLAMIVSPLGAADAFTEGDNEVVLDLPPDTQESIWDAIPARLYESHKKDHLTYITPIHDRASLHITLIRFNRALSPHELDRVRQIAEEVVGEHTTGST